MVRNQGSSAGRAVHDSSSKSFPSRNGNRKRRGPTNLDTHSKPKTKVVINTNTAQGQSDLETVPVGLQQAVLNIFRAALADVLDNPTSGTNLKSLVQEVKGHLYNRDFAKAFSSEEYLEVYAARWSASRALGYTEVFTKALNATADHKSTESKDVVGKLSDSTAKISLATAAPGDEDASIEVVCLGGGGGAEMCALAAALPLVDRDTRLDIVVVDSADWSQVLNKLETSLQTTPVPSQDTDDGTETPSLNAIVSLSDLRTTFQHLDILDQGEEAHSLNSALSSADVITLAFTLNELYTTSISKTQKFLLNLTIAAKPGSLLLVIDSPGSYSSITLNGSEKQYPMQWLLEHTLLTTAPKALAPELEAVDSTSADPDVAAKPTRPPRLWDCIESTPSRWFRLPPTLKYPLELENMRYQFSLWRRL